MAGAETGVELADSLSARMGLRSNGEAKSLARRNKYVMGEAVRQSGVRAVKQRACTSAPQVIEFLASLTAVPLKCVVKPVQSAGTDDVFLCGSEEEALTAFSRIFMKRNGLGLVNESVLVQEFLAGKEYVIDKVSRDGVHKLVAIWEYDKRSVNNANFVYFGMRLCHPGTDKVSCCSLPSHLFPSHLLPFHLSPSHLLPFHLLPSHLFPFHLITHLTLFNPNPPKSPRRVPWWSTPTTSWTHSTSARGPRTWR